MFIPRLSQEEKSKRQIIFISLPQDLKFAIVSEETADKLYNIGWGKFKLEKEKQRIISFTTGETMLGLIKLEEFSKILAERLEINITITEKIVQDINQEIFRPVINSLLRAQKKFTAEKGVASATKETTIAPLRNENVIDLKNQQKF